MLTSKRSAEHGWYSRSNIFFLNLKFNRSKEKNWRNVEVKLSKEYKNNNNKKTNSKSWERENRWRKWVNQKRLVTAASCDISISHKLALYEHSCTCFVPMMPNRTKWAPRELYVGAKNAYNDIETDENIFRTKTNTSATELQAARSLLFTISRWRKSSQQNFLANNIFFSFVFVLFWSLYSLFISLQISSSLSFVFFFSNSSVHYFQAIDWKLHTYRRCTRKRI